MKASALLAFIVLSGGACKDGDFLPLTGELRAAESEVALCDGDEAEVVVQVLDAAGQPLNGVAVTWTAGATLKLGATETTSASDEDTGVVRFGIVKNTVAYSDKPIGSAVIASSGNLTSVIQVVVDDESCDDGE